MIRLAEEKDINSILELLGQVLRVHHDIRPDLFKETGSKYTANELKEIIADNSLQIFVYEEESKVLGYAMCKLVEIKDSSARYDTKEYYIDDLCVNESYRGKGIGKKLMNYVIDYANANNYDEITLNVWNSNDDALKFYMKQGFSERKKTLEMKLPRK